MNTVITERLKGLRAQMKKAGVDYYMIPTADFHNSEYAADYFKEREYFCNFNGSNGTLVVSADAAGLWTDGRYWIQAADQLKGTGVRLYKMMEPGVPTIREYLLKNMTPGSRLGFDGRCITRREGAELAQLLAEKNIRIASGRDLGDPVWKDRPALPCHDLFVITDKTAGESFEEKLGKVRSAMKQRGADYFVCSKLDDLMWLTNLRGNDVECNPVALCYGFFSQKEQHLFLQDAEVTAAVRRYCAAKKIELHPYDSFVSFLAAYSYKGAVLYDPDSVSYSLYLAMQKGMRRAAKTLGKERIRFIEAGSPVEIMKAVKNPVEQKNVRSIYLEDSAVVCRFLYWLCNEADIAHMTEYDTAEKLDGMRAEVKDFIELSFPTIAAYGPNAAMMHYEPTKEKSSALDRSAMLLIDSGGTYMRGTTDITRTTALGPVTDEMKKAYTLTAAGNLALLHASWMDGCTGRNLDILAREPLWNIGSDYKCGTGHGIGYILNVHEGPQNIRWRFSKGADEVPVVPGMILSDEPGVYKDGKYGIRIETILMAQEKCRTADGQFFCFETLTYVPLDRNLLDPRYLSSREIEWVNEYHRQTLEKITPLVDKKVGAWLKKQCAPIR